MTALLELLFPFSRTEATCSGSHIQLVVDLGLIYSVAQTCTFSITLPCKALQSLQGREMAGWPRVRAPGRHERGREERGQGDRERNNCGKGRGNLSRDLIKIYFWRQVKQTKLRVIFQSSPLTSTKFWL